MKNIIVIILLFFSLFAYTQSFVSVKLSSFNYTLIKSKHYDYVKDNQLTDYLFLTPGVILNFDKFFSGDYLSARFSQSFFLDKAKKKSAFTFIGLRRKFMTSYKHSANISIGPSIILRENWNDLPNYRNPYNFILLKNGMEYRIKALNLELEYNYQISSKTDLSISLNHSIPHDIALYIGFRFWVNKKIKKKNCMSCPNFH